MSEEEKDFFGLFDQLITAAKEHQSQMPNSGTHLPRKCLKLYDEGWKQDGFEFVENSSDIDFFWKRGEERTRIRLSLPEQQLWISELDRRKEQGKL